MHTGTLAIDAFAELGILARPGSGPESDVDLVLEPATVAVDVTLKHRSLVTEETASRLLSELKRPDLVLMIVGDRVTDAARKVLTARGAGYLDLRGRLALHTKHLVIDAPVHPLNQRPERRHALTGKAGIEVAVEILLRPHMTLPVRELARHLGRSPSTVSDVRTALRRGGLLDSSNNITGTELFWAVADHWRTPRTHLANPLDAGDNNQGGLLRLGLSDAEHEQGWALTGTAAAAAYGAPVAVRAGQALEFYVPDQSTIRRARTLLGTTPSASQASAIIQIAPTPAVVTRRVAPPPKRGMWPLAHPLFVALDLAQDLGRGRDVLNDWTPGDRWVRVW